MPFIKCIMTSTQRRIAHTDFEAQDVKGRVIGAKVTVWEETRTEDATGQSWRLTEWTGERYAFEPHATRNGVNYGACQRTQYFETEAARADAIAKYLVNARKRAAKIVA